MQPPDRLPLAEQAWLRLQADDIPPQRRAATAFLLARLLWRNDPARTRRLAQLAADSYREAGDVYADELAEVRTWLASHRP